MVQMLMVTILTIIFIKRLLSWLLYFSNSILAPRYHFKRRLLSPFRQLRNISWPLPVFPEDFLNRLLYFTMQRLNPMGI